MVCLASAQHRLFASHSGIIHIGHGYIHKLQGGSDPTATFLVQNLLSAGHQLNRQLDLRKPIDKPLLSRLLGALEFTVPGKHHRALYKAKFGWLSMPSYTLVK